MIDPAFCPGCGHNLRAEQPVSIGALEHDPRGEARWGGRALGLTASEHLVLGSLVAAAGGFVTRPALEERIGYEGLTRVTDVYLLRIRRKLGGAGAPVGVIENVRGRGHRLNLELLEGAPGPRQSTTLTGEPRC